VQADGQREMAEMICRELHFIIRGGTGQLRQGHHAGIVDAGGCGAEGLASRAGRRNRGLIAANAPLAVQAALAAARRPSAHPATRQVLLDWNRTVLGSRDAAEGVSAVVERRAPVFEGR